MKKRLLLGLAALAAVTFTSCQKDQVINQSSENNAIEFGTYVGRDAQTKGHIQNNTTIETEGFGVFAYYTGTGAYSNTDSKPNFMYNEKITKSGTDWTYSPVKYWPNNDDDKLSFFAYAPYDSSGNIELSSNETGGTPIIKYTVNDDVTKHVDLLWAAPTIDRTKQKIDEKINFAFKHALSRIGFTVQHMIDHVNGDTDSQIDDALNATTELTDTKVRIESLSLSGYFYTSGSMKYDLTGGDWSVSFINRTASNKTFTLKNDTKTDNTDYGNFDAVSDVVTKDKTKLNNNESYLMILPQDFTSSELTLNVVYTVTTTDSKLSGEKSEIKNNITKTFTVENSFEAGKAYNLCLHLGLTSVKLSATVGDWTDGGDFVVNVPINTK